jgi:DNA-binding LytR/AlgR family response regulator
MFSVLIAEDEKPSSDNLVAMLKEIDKTIHVAAVVQSVRETIQWLQTNARPALIFMDVKLKDGLSFSIFQHVTVTTPVIFTTAFDDYLVEAFEHNGIDYLLKPLNKIKLVKAVEKFKGLQAHFLFDYLPLIDHMNEAKGSKKNRISAKRGTELRSIKYEDVAYFFTENKIVFLVTKENEKYLVSKRLRELEDELDPLKFYRANRKYIINIDHVRKAKQLNRSQLQIELLIPMTESIIVSQENSAAFREWLDSI